MLATAKNPPDPSGTRGERAPEASGHQGHDLVDNHTA